METVLTIIVIPVIFVIPGWLTWYAFCGNRNSSARLNIIELMFLKILISIIIVSVFSLLLAVVGWFSLNLLVVFTALYNIILIICFRKSIFRFGFSGAVFDVTVLLLLIILIVAGTLYLRPFEYILGGWDPGVYVNTGINIAKTGAIRIYDPLLDSMDPAEQRPFYHIRGGLLQKYSAFPIDDPARGTIIPYFYHMYPVWIAVFTVLFGIMGSLYVNAVFGMLCLLAVYLLCRTLFNRAVGILAGLLLSINIAQVWLARFPTTEIFCQFCLISGFYTTALFMKDRRPLYGIVGAFCFGVAFFTRFDVILLIPPVVAVFYCRSFPRFKMRDLYFIVPFALLVLLGVIYDWTIARKPTMVILGALDGLINKTTFVYIAVLTIVVAAALRTVPGKIGPIVENLFKHRRWWRYTIIGLLILLSIYSYFLRPHLATSRDASNLVQLGWFLSPLGLLLALIGVALYLNDGLDKHNILFFLGALVVSCFFIYRKLVFPQYMWAIRRFVPLVIPSFIVFCGYALYRMAAGIGKLGKPLATACTAALVAFSLIKGAPSFGHTEYKGIVNFCRQLSRKFSDQDIIVCETDWLATPLQYIFDRKTLQVSDQNKEKCAQVLRVIEKLLENDRRVYYISNGQYVVTDQLDFVLQHQLPLDTRILERGRRFPTKIKPFDPVVKVFEVRPYGRRRVDESVSDVTIDIGYNVFGLVGGFSSRRTCRDPAGGICSYRWTKRAAELIIPWFGDQVPARLILRADSGKSDEADGVEVSVYIDDQLIGEVTVASGFRQYELDIPAGSIKTDRQQRARLTLRSKIADEKQDQAFKLDWLRIYSEQP